MVTTFDVGAALDRGRWTGLQKWFVFLVALTIVFDGIDNQLLAIAIPAIMRDWSVPRSAFAFVLASGMFGMMVGGALAGVIGDRLGRKTALLGSVGVFGVLTLAVSTATTLPHLTILRFVSGLGLGGAIPNAAALAAEFVPRHRRAIAVTLAIVCVPLGGMLAAVLAELLPSTWGWRGLFVIGGLLPAITALVLLTLLPESPRFLAVQSHRWPALTALMRRLGHDTAPGTQFVDSTEPSAGHVAIGTLLAPEFRRDTLALWLAYFSCLLGVYTAFNWVPSLLAGAGLAAIASRGILAFNAGGAIGAVLGGIVIGRIGSRPTMLVMAGGAVAGCLVLAATHLSAATSVAPLIVILAFTGGLINAVQTTMYALAAQVYPTAIRSTGVGTAVAIGRAGGVVSSYAGQWAIATGGSARFFTLMACAMSVVFAALAAVKRHIARRNEPRVSSPEPHAPPARVAHD